MAPNGLLIRSDNSDAAYKRLLGALTARETGSNAPMPYAVALEALSAGDLALGQRRRVLAEATVLWCLLRAIRVCLLCGVAPALVYRTLQDARPEEADRKLRVVLAVVPEWGRGG